jgi:tyrosyl-DNA phosphodiesterase 1
MQDFPLMTVSMTKEQAGHSRDFFTTLCDYLAKQKIDTTRLHRYDFSAAQVVLITSVPGYHSGDQLHRYGHMKLRRVLQQTPIANRQGTHDSIMCQASSIGALDGPWLKHMITSTFAQRNQANFTPGMKHCTIDITRSSRSGNSTV